MGGGASSAAGFGAATSKMGESDLKDIVSAMDPETLEKLHKVVTEVAGTKASRKKGSPTAGDGAGNFKEASEMKRAMFAWSSDIAFEALKEISLAEKMPMGITGKYLILDSVFKGDLGWREGS
ncbi:unnamed protein product [Symbiodinium natans]|uniref:Uncharacterized protein n=1 Tax=Symbiodinium natans TaxID=878477 RepID=A0A812M809_9DINO|nr:unnamed protein product [Symbiodinium natans]